jgi:hypothetical protein
MRRRFATVSMLACLLAALGFLAAPMAMAADDVAIVGTLVSPDGKPVVGVAITVEAEGFSQAATTGADGKFSIPVPKGGTYQVTVDETTLPAGVTLANPDDASRSILVLNGQKRLLFKLSVGGESTNGSSDGAGTDTSDNGLVGQVSQLLVDGVLFGILIALGAVSSEIGPVSVTPKSLILAAIASVAIAATVLWLQRSRIGKATRAVSDNPALASATGIDVERVISVVWTLGAGLAAFAGIYLGLTQDVSWNMGQRLLLVMFAAVSSAAARSTAPSWGPWS